MEALGEKAGVSKQYISVLEKGEPHQLTNKPVTPSREIIEAIAQKAAAARWKADDSFPYAIHEGLLPLGDTPLECYVLKDGRRVFHKRSMRKAIGLRSVSGSVFLRTINSKGLGSLIPDKTKETLNNPIIFRHLQGGLADGYEATVLIDICDAIWEAKQQKKLTQSQYLIGVKAEIILRSAAKIGIVALIDEATGYIKDKGKEEYRELFREFIRNECREWEREFPEQFFDLIYKLYKLPRKHKNKHPQFFGHFIRKYVYAPLANSNGAILEMLDEKNPIVYTSGGRKYKMHTFLTETVGIPSLKAHLWQIIGIGAATRSKDSFERGFNKAFPQIGHQYELFDDDEF